MAVSANRLELLQIADAVAREKSIDRMIVIQSMQDAIEKAAKTRYGAETDVRAEINPRTGELKLTRLREVVENVEEPARQITLPEAQARNSAAKLVMTDRLLNMAEADQDENPIDEGDDVETVELNSDDALDDPQAGTADDAAGKPELSEEIQ